MPVRHLFKFSSDPYAPGKVEVDLSLAAKADCIAGVPKVSPAGDRVALFLFCAADPPCVCCECAKGGKRRRSPDKVVARTDRTAPRTRARTPNETRGHDSAN